MPPASSSVQRIDRSQPLVYVARLCWVCNIVCFPPGSPLRAGEAFVGVGGAPPTTLPIREAGGYPVVVLLALRAAKRRACIERSGLCQVDCMTRMVHDACELASTGDCWMILRMKRRERPHFYRADGGSHGR